MSDRDDKSPEQEPSKEEQQQARSLARQVDELLAGKGLPPVADIEGRELLQLSSMIHASHNEVPLADSRKASLIEAALAQSVPVSQEEARFSEPTSLDAARRRRKGGWVFVLGGVVAAAAIVFLLLRPKKPAATSRAPVAKHEVLPAAQQSRASDALIGQIDQPDSAEARERLDRIYDDRMGGYRAAQYRRLVNKQ